MFSNLTVLELANVLAGPSVGMFFAELGAKVVKIENCTHGGDTTRRWKLPSEDTTSDISAYFTSVNWGKKSVAIDLRTRPGKDILWHLAAKADIVITSYKHGDAAKLGADYETLRSHRSDLIYGSIDGYGADDPRVAFDAVLQAESGFMDMTGERNGPPTKMPVALIDLLAAHQLKEGILLALLERQRTGQGSEVRASLMHSAVASLANQLSGWLVAGVSPERMGSDHPSIVPYGTVFRTQDNRYVVLGVGTDAQFKNFCEELSLSALSSDPRFNTNEQRVVHRKELIDLLSQEISSRSCDDLVKNLSRCGVPAAKVTSIPEVALSASALDLRLKSRETFGGAPCEGTRTIAFSSSSTSKMVELSPPPHLGEHTEQTLKDIGYSPKTIESLRLASIIR